MLSISTTGTDELTRHFRQIQKKVKNHKVLYKRIGIKILRYVNDNFKAEGKESKWKKLSKLTIQARRKKSSKILQDTGKLKQSYTYKVGRRSVKIGSPLKIAKHHEFGTKSYQIVPKKKKALLFGVNPAERARLAKKAGSKAEKGKAIFSKGVQHPGLVARPMLPSKELGLMMSIQVADGFVKEAIK